MAALKGKTGKRKRFRAPRSKPTPSMVGRLFRTLRMSDRDTYSREDVVRIVEYTVGLAQNVPDIFEPPLPRQRSTARREREDRELALPEPERALGVRDPDLALRDDADDDVTT